jgi:cytochrome c5
MNANPLSTLAALLILVSCQSPSSSESETRPTGVTVLTPSALAAARSRPVQFTAHVKPILAAKCVMCHKNDAQPGKMDLSSKAAALRTGAIGLWIVPGKPDQSLLLTKTANAPAHLKAMPPVGEQITPDELSVLRKWVAEGADWPSGSAGLVSPPK